MLGFSWCELSSVWNWWLGFLAMLHIYKCAFVFMPPSCLIKCQQIFVLLLQRLAVRMTVFWISVMMIFFFLEVLVMKLTQMMNWQTKVPGEQRCFSTWVVISISFLELYRWKVVDKFFLLVAESRLLVLLEKLCLACPAMKKIRFAARVTTSNFLF